MVGYRMRRKTKLDRARVADEAPEQANTAQEAGADSESSYEYVLDEYGNFIEEVVATVEEVQEENPSVEDQPPEVEAETEAVGTVREAEPCGAVRETVFAVASRSDLDGFALDAL